MMKKVELATLTVTLSLFSIPACGSRDSVTRFVTQNGQLPITIDTSNQGIRQAFPVQNAQTSLDGMFPFSISIQPDLVSSAGGFRLTMSWDYVKPKLAIYPTYRLYWSVLMADPDYPGTYSVNGYPSATSDTSETFSSTNPLYAGSVYQFQLVASVVQTDSSGNDVASQRTDTNIALVTVDLRSAVAK